MARGFVKHVLSGARGTVKVNGVEWFEATGINASVTANRAEVQDGMDIDTKVVSESGEVEELAQMLMMKAGYRGDTVAVIVKGADEVKND